MYKMAEKLVEKYLTKAAIEICAQVVKDHFSTCFADACFFPDEKYTTIGQTCRILENIAQKKIEAKFDELMDEVSNEMNIVRASPHSNPFSAIACSLWDEFVEYYSIKGFASGIVYDECVERFDDLKANGTLNSEGDYIGK